MFAKKSWKKILLGTSDAWLMIHLSHRPSHQAYLIVDWRISICTSSIAKTGVSCTTYQTWTSLPKGSIVAFYNGIRLNSSSVLLEERYGRSDYRIRLNADRDLDIPKGYESSSKYCATLAHKAHRFRFEIFILWIDNFKLKKLKNLF